MIEVRELTKRFGDRIAVDGISFEVRDGCVLALVGTSGCGKSTTLRMINRLVDPSSGEVMIDGRNALDMPLEQLRLGIGYVIQGIGLFPHWTVARNVATVPRLMGWERERIEARVSELLELFQLDPGEFAGKYPSELSGGQQQRVGVARAIAAEPAVLLMDEPFGALDPITRQRLQAEFAAIQRRRRMTVILVTHDMDEAFKLADTIAVMDEGRILQIASPEELLREPRQGFVRTLVGLDDRALRILSLHTVDEIRREPTGRWEVRGETLIDRESGRAVNGLGAGDTLREAASRIIWEAVETLPVLEAGSVVGEVRADDVWAAGGRRA
ncbi:ABC transporter ATP-binding protein [Lutibaculum baratangense]|uniref:L-proline glycine betaine ABC transport system permease protein ProV n=1 Tax=Lutibaculum baratangense AMV1 TaxID=631454 RepID=V4TP02_9HYPH|nr:ABC transporter ATP-binding protein [Lutibaculum baratangense]ESR27403.1 L-proline glycine betaine ABC transport system permease protein ProV [Lutibaculum baratangense AMV1]